MNGGEDAFYISPDNRVIAVADGVGSWNYEGVDPGVYSRTLVKGIELAYDHK